MSTFSGITSASRALAAARTAMETTGQNIANVNTEGYSRQRVEQSSSAVGEDGLWSRRGVTGDGVEITGISRTTDAFVDATLRQDDATKASTEKTAQVWKSIETTLGEPGTASLTTRLSQFYSSWSDLSNAQGDSAVSSNRVTVVARSQAVADTVKGLDTQLTQQWGNERDNLTVLADQVTATASKVAALNTAIARAQNSGASPNELMDQRDQLVGKLSDLTGARVQPGRNGSLDVYVGNAALVSGGDAQAASITSTGPNPPAFTTLGEVKAGTAKLSLTIGRTATEPASGTLQATLDAVNTTVPGVAKDYDATAQSIASAVNGVYNPTRAAGYTGAVDTTKDFFTQPATASALTLVSGDPTTIADSTPGTVDRAVAKGLGKLPESTTSPSKTWRDKVTSFATTSSAATTRAELASDVALKSSAARESVSGVNLDEEMTNLVAFQHAYNGAARVLNAIDEALDKLINGTGLVGR